MLKVPSTRALLDVKKKNSAMLEAELPSIKEIRENDPAF
jgi:hypothetical protein